MITPHAPAAQYRSFLHIYSFKVTETALFLKIYDLFQERTFKETIPFEKLGSPTVEILSRPSELMEILRTNNLIPPERESYPPFTLEACLEYLQKHVDATKDDSAIHPLAQIQDQLQNGDIQNAIITLEQVLETYPDKTPILTLLFKLYELAEQTQNAIKPAVKLTMKLKREASPEANTQLLELYLYIFTKRPNTFTLYLFFADFLDDPREKAHMLLKGACHALERQNYTVAHELSKKAYRFQPHSFLDRLIDFQILSQQNIPSEEKLLEIATVFERENLPALMIKTYRLLTQITYNPTYYNKIIAGYIDQPQKALKWTLQYLNLLIEKKEWEMAEQVAFEAFQKTSTPIPLYEKLETIYTNWNQHQLMPLLGSLGNAYQENEQLEAAEKTYRKAFDKFNTFEHALALAEILIQQNKINQGIQTYYQASSMAFQGNDSNALNYCLSRVRQIDPRLECLELTQRMQLFTNSKILELSHQMQSLEEKLDSQQGGNVTVRDLTPERIEPPLSPFLQKMAFGKAKWAQYFGDVGEEPPLPPEIEKILNYSCFVWPEKKIHQTHLLVLIPKTVGGQPFNLNLLEELIKKPLGKGKATKYKSYWDEIKEEFGNVAPSSSYWLLITKDVIPNSRRKRADYQKHMIATMKPITGLAYEIPLLLEVATAILMEHVKTGNKLYGNKPATHTRVQERLRSRPDMPLMVGGFGDDGLCILGNADIEMENFGVGAVLTDF